MNLRHPFCASILALLLIFPSLANANLQYEACTSENKYLEADIQSALSLIHPKEKFCTNKNGFEFKDYYSLESAVSEQDLRCVQAVQEAKDFSSYARCIPNYKGNGFTEIHTSVRPCISEGHVDVTARSFKMAAHCVGLDASEMFKLYAHESSMQPNAKSGTGAAGPTQLINIALRGFADYQKLFQKDSAKKIASNKALAEIEKNIQRGGCEIFRNPLMKVKYVGNGMDHGLYQFIPETAGNDCSILSFPRNPLLPFFWGMVNYKISRVGIKNVVAQWNKNRTHRYSQSELEKITVALTRFGYNGGDEQILNLFKQFSVQHKADKLSSNQILGEFSNYLFNHYKDGYGNRPGAARLKEISNFNSDIEETFKPIQDKVGDCFHTPKPIPSKAPEPGQKTLDPNEVDNIRQWLKNIKKP